MSSTLELRLPPSSFPFLVSGSILSSLPRDWLLRCIDGTSHLVHSRLYRCLVLRGHRRVIRILLFSTDCPFVSCNFVHRRFYFVVKSSAPMSRGSGGRRDKNDVMPGKKPPLDWAFLAQQTLSLRRLKVSCSTLIAMCVTSVVLLSRACLNKFRLNYVYRCGYLPVIFRPRFPTRKS